MLKPFHIPHTHIKRIRDLINVHTECIGSQDSSVTIVTTESLGLDSRQGQRFFFSL